MYPSNFATENPNRAAFIMAGTGEQVTYREYEARCNQLAHVFKNEALNFEITTLFLWKTIIAILSVAARENGPGFTTRALTLI